ncbi:uncharacterized protein [Dermacentor andersoni]|uniref:uncharacterized protein isoform X2 n=1 Tax=Dermacentor andersoni TaxID=34620 RepID=UPI0021557C0A|nr:mucin-5AC-like isoform X2 [Dermacentor andersoni]
MSIVMVGPFPGPFDRTHYSDSSGEHTTDREQSRPPKARAPALRQPGPYLRMLQEQEPAGTPGTPHDGVAYSAVMQTDTGAPPPAYIPTWQEPQPETPPEPPRPDRAAPSAKSKCYALLRRLAVVALVLAVAAVVAGAVSRGVRGGGARTDTEPIKARNAAVKSANATGRKSAACPCSESSTTHTTPATVEGPGGHGTPTGPGAARHRRHRGGTSHGRKTGRSSLLSSSPSSSSSSTSSSPDATTEAPWQTAEAAEREVPREPALRDVGDLTPSGQRTVPTISEPTRTSEGAAVTAATSTSQAAAGEASSLTGAPAGEATGRDDRGRQSGLESAPTASTVSAVSLASSAAEATAEVGSVPVAKTTASTDLPEVINEADARTDEQEV